MEQPPPFVARSKLLASAYELAHSAHHGPGRRGDTDIEHPLAVAELLHENGFDEQVVAAGLLHDVVEDTDVELSSLAESFAPEVCELVAEMTEDPEIESYPDRKAEHRSRVVRDRSAAAIYAADKLATTRGLEGSDGLPPDKLDHYRRTLEVLCERYPDLPFLPQLRDELARLPQPRS